MERERGREKNIFIYLYIYREREREWERMRERERRRENEIEWEQQIINKIEINAHLLVKWKDPIKLGRFRQKALHPSHDKRNGYPVVNPRNFRDLLMQILKLVTLWLHSLGFIMKSVVNFLFPRFWLFTKIFKLDSFLVDPDWSSKIRRIRILAGYRE